MDIQEILNQGNYHLIDVREPEELIANGAIEGAENIPLGEVENHADEIAKLDGNVVFFCRSGNRSGKATEAFKQRGFTNVYNGGGYEELSKLLQFLKNKKSNDSGCLSGGYPYSAE